MVLRQRLCILSVFLLGVKMIFAQQEASFAHYWAMEPSFNPGAVGKESKLNVAGAYNMSFGGYEHNPKTMYIAADMPLRFLNAMHGVGIQLLNDEIGLFTHKRILVQYAYKFRMLGGTLSIGVQGGMLNEGFKGSEVVLPDEETDPAFVTTDVNGSAMDVSTGLYYQRKSWYLGFSALHLTAPSVDLGDKSVFDISRMFYLTGGYNDRKMLYAGVGYSPTNSVTAMVGGNFHGICLGYSYEMFTSGTGMGNGCHELFVGYQMDLNFVKKGRNRHQSVRIL